MSGTDGEGAPEVTRSGQSRSSEERRSENVNNALYVVNVRFQKARRCFVVRDLTTHYCFRGVGMRFLRPVPFVMLTLIAAPIAAFAQDTPFGPNAVVVAVDTPSAAGNAVDLGQPSGPAPTPEHTGIWAVLSDLFNDVKHVPAKENVWIAAI